MLALMLSRSQFFPYGRGVTILHKSLSWVPLQLRLQDSRKLLSLKRVKQAMLPIVILREQSENLEIIHAHIL